MHSCKSIRLSIGSLVIQVICGGVGEMRSDLPLVVDLDGTLIKTDTLFELANQHIFSSPWGIFDLARWSRTGRANLKNELAQRHSVDAATLPYQQEVVDYLSQERSRGRKVILATASNERSARSIAEFLGLFDEVLASDDKVNLKSSLKADALISKFGDEQFEYVGDAKADLAVWRVAGKASMVGRAEKFASSIPRDVPTFNIPVTRLPLVKRALKTLRVHQWAKNLLIFAPLVVTHQFNDFGSVLSAVLAFLAFSLAASSIYIVNDLIDIPNDREHATKRYRMLASGEVSILAAWFIWPLLLASSLAIAVIWLPIAFVVILCTYAATTLVYSLRLKRIPVIDVVTLAGLYTIRIVAGAAAISAPVSFWIMTFSLFLFFSLALMKRFSELMELRIKQQKKKVKGRGYVHQDLELVSSLGAGSGLIAVLVFMFYVQDPKIAPLYASPSVLWLTGPLLLVWIARAWLIAHRGDMHEDPIVFAIRDKGSYAVFGAIVLVFAWATLL